MSIRRQLVVSGALVCLALGGVGACSQTPQSPTSTVTENQGEEKLNVTVSILPQQYFVEKIGGDRVNVQVFVPEGSEAEIYEPKPQQLAELSNADAYIGVGIFFEEIWSERIKTANEDMLLTDSSAGIEKIEMVAHSHDHDDHDEHADHEGHKDHKDHDEHAEHGEHKEDDHEEHAGHDHDEHAEHKEHGEHKEDDHEEHAGHDHDAHAAHGENLSDPHTWLSPKLAKVHAQNIYDALVELDPDSEATFKANLDSLIVEIDEVDQAIAATLENISTRTFLVFHPAWGYFANDYNLEQVAIEVEGQEPSAAELAELITIAEEEDIRVVFAQYQFNSKAANTIAQEIGAEVVYIDPLSPDWATNIQAIAEELALASN